MMKDLGLQNISSTSPEGTSSFSIGEESPLQGLDSNEVMESRKRYGKNLLSPKAHPSMWRQYFNKFTDPIILVLLVAVALAFIIGLVEGEWVDTVGVLLAILLVTGIKFYFESSSLRQFEMLEAFEQENLVFVVREGKVAQIPASDIVVGDVVLLKEGMEIPADGVLIDASLSGDTSFKENKSSATSEVFAHSFFTKGPSAMLVKAVGDATKAGRKNRSSDFKAFSTPLSRELEHFSERVSRIGIIIAGIIFIVSTVHALSAYFGGLLPSESSDSLKVTVLVLNNFMIALALVVLVVPEGLSLTVSLNQALNMRKMLSCQIRLRNLSALESMGAVNVICTNDAELVKNEEPLVDVCRRAGVEVKVVTEDALATVRQLKEAGAVVAATGKSVDDVPLLSEVQVGLSMGNAMAMAKEVSDITIQDNSFKSVVAAVMWGRSLYRNVQRFMAFQLIISLTAMALCLVGSFVNTELPLSVTQILWINIIIDTLASLALSTVPPSIELMAGRPRKVEESLLTPAVKRYVIGAFLAFTVVLALILLYFNRWGGNMDVSDLTVLFTVFVSLQFWALLNIRSLGSRHSVFYQLGKFKSLLVVLALILVGQIVFVQFGGEVFHTQPLSIWEWLGCLGLSSFVLWIGEAWRLIK